MHKIMAGEGRILLNIEKETTKVCKSGLIMGTGETTTIFRVTDSSVDWIKKGDIVFPIDVPFQLPVRGEPVYISNVSDIAVVVREDKKA